MADKKAALMLRTAEQKAVAFRKAKAGVRTAQDNIDDAIRKAREAGATYRELADAVGMSTAWVQNALHRSGYKPEPR